MAIIILGVRTSNEKLDVANVSRSKNVSLNHWNMDAEIIEKITKSNISQYKEKEWHYEPIMTKITF